MATSEKYFHYNAFRDRMAGKAFLRRSHYVTNSFISERFKQNSINIDLTPFGDKLLAAVDPFLSLQITNILGIRDIDIVRYFFYTFDLYLL